METFANKDYLSDYSVIKFGYVIELQVDPILDLFLSSTSTVSFFYLTRDLVGHDGDGPPTDDAVSEVTGALPGRTVVCYLFIGMLSLISVSLVTS